MNVTALERAFQLAKSGKCTSVRELINQLKSEGHYTNQIVGPTLSKQLRALMKAASERESKTANKQLAPDELGLRTKL